MTVKKGECDIIWSEHLQDVFTQNLNSELTMTEYKNYVERLQQAFP